MHLSKSLSRPGIYPRQFNIDEERSGLVHISEISNKYVRNPADFANVGEEITVQVIGNNNDGNLKLSIKKVLLQKK